MKPIYIIATWFCIIFTLALNGMFAVNLGELPLLMIACIFGPPVVFTLIYAGSHRARMDILQWNLIILVSIHAWRVGGEAMVVMYQYGHLPALFALPAGIGDIIVGITAPYIIWQLIRDASYVTSRGFLWWNVFGLVDLVVAVTMGLAHSGVFIDVPLPTTVMSQFTMVLIPTFFVPLIAILHIAMLMIRRDVMTR